MINKQKGFGMVEVIVAVLVLGLGLVGAVSVISKSTQVAFDSQKLVQASVFGKDVLESITMIPYSTYQVASTMQNEDTQKFTDKDCFNSLNNSETCSKTELIQFLTNQRFETMRYQGISAKMQACPQNYESTQTCLVLAWGQTMPTIGSGELDCATHTGNVFVPNKDANCLIVEGY